MNEQYLQKVIEICHAQEETLRFSSFGAQEAYRLGVFMAERHARKGIQGAIAIRTPEGLILFQHMTDGCCLNYQHWMDRKARTVLTFKACSLRVWAQSLLWEEPVEAHGYSAADYAFCGGGFPILLKDGTLAAILTVSSLPHLTDHRIITESLSEFLGIEAVPQVEEEA